MAIDLVGFGIVLPILPRYARDLSISPTTIGLIVGSFSLAQMVFSPIMGRLSDLFGRKPVLIFSLCGTAVGSLLTGLAGPVWLLFAGPRGRRGPPVPACRWPRPRSPTSPTRATVRGCLVCSVRLSGVGFVARPGRWMARRPVRGGPHIPFFVAAAIASINAAVALRRLPETHTRHAVAHGNRQAIASKFAPPAPCLRPAQSPATAIRLILVTFMRPLRVQRFRDRRSPQLGGRPLPLTRSWSTGAIFTVIGSGLVFVQAGLIHPGSVHARLVENHAIRLGVQRRGARAGGGGPRLGVPSYRRCCFSCWGRASWTPTLSSAVAGEVPADERGRLLGFQQSAGSFSRFVGPAGGRARCTSTSASPRRTSSGRRWSSWRCSSCRAWPTPAGEPSVAIVEPPPTGLNPTWGGRRAAGVGIAPFGPVYARGVYQPVTSAGKMLRSLSPLSNRGPQG